MPDIQIRTLSTAPKVSRKTLDVTRESIGLTPKFYEVFAWSPAVAKADRVAREISDKDTALNAHRAITDHDVAGNSVLLAWAGQSRFLAGRHRDVPDSNNTMTT